MGKKKGRKPEAQNLGVSAQEIQEQTKTCFYEGEKLAEMLEKISREIEEERKSKDGIPDKIWTKMQFAIGVNDVTRVLERMSKGSSSLTVDQESVTKVSPRRRSSPLVPLQAVLVVVDCTPKLLTQHIPILARSVGVPLIPVRDNGGGSFRLGQLVKLKTAMAIGVKARGSRINKAIEEFLDLDPP